MNKLVRFYFIALLIKYIIIVFFQVLPLIIPQDAIKIILFFLVLLTFILPLIILFKSKIKQQRIIILLVYIMDILVILAIIFVSIMPAKNPYLKKNPVTIQLNTFA